MNDDEFSDAQANVLRRYGVHTTERWVPAPSVEGAAHVLVAGEGPPVVLLNGIGVPAAMLAPLMARLDGFTHYAIDLPAYGLSDTTGAFADDLRANAVGFLCEVFDGLGLVDPTVISNSLGSLCASWLAIDEPGRVAALVHIGCPAIVLDTSAPLPMRLLSVRPLGRLITRLQPPSERQVEQLAKMVHEHPLPPEIAQLILATERLDHFDETFLATLNHLIHVHGNRAEPRSPLNNSPPSTCRPCSSSRGTTRWAARGWVSAWQRPCPTPASTSSTVATPRGSTTLRRSHHSSKRSCTGRAGQSTPESRITEHVVRPERRSPAR